MAPEYNIARPLEIFSSRTLGPAYYPVICANGVRSFVVAPSLTELAIRAGFRSAPYVNGGGIYGLNSQFFPDNAPNLARHLLSGGIIINVAGHDMNVPLIGALHTIQPKITLDYLNQIISFVYNPGTKVTQYPEIIAIFGNP